MKDDTQYWYENDEKMRFCSLCEKTTIPASNGQKYCKPCRVIVRHNTKRRSSAKCRKHVEDSERGLKLKGDLIYEQAIFNLAYKVIETCDELTCWECAVRELCPIAIAGVSI